MTTLSDYLNQFLGKENSTEIPRILPVPQTIEFDIAYICKLPLTEELEEEWDSSMGGCHMAKPEGAPDHARAIEVEMNFNSGLLLCFMLCECEMENEEFPSSSYRSTGVCPQQGDMYDCGLPLKERMYRLGIWESTYDERNTYTDKALGYLIDQDTQGRFELYRLALDFEDFFVDEDPVACLKIDGTMVYKRVDAFSYPGDFHAPPYCDTHHESVSSAFGLARSKCNEIGLSPVDKIFLSNKLVAEYTQEFEECKQEYLTQEFLPNPQRLS